jgi:CRISPR/Cas system-associated exonuclease Cas4 (RecB family)
LRWEKIIFAGFNALTPAEEKIIKALVDAEKADLLWDVDKYYVENEAQEAGLFLRRLQKSLKLDNFKWMGGNFGLGKKKIEIIGVPQNVGQAKIAAKILKAYSENEESISQTAVVLNDEAMMLPVLNSIPAEINSFNLTMGLPLDQSPLFSLYEAFFSLHENALKFDKTGGKQLRYYFRDLLNIAEHTYLKSFIGSVDESKEKQVVKKLKSQNKIFYKPEELSDLFASLPNKDKETFVSLFEPWRDNPRKALDNLIAITVFLKEIETGKGKNEMSSSSDALKIEYLFHYSKVFKRLEKLLAGFPYLNNIRSLHQLFHQIVGSLTISFYGEPLTGLQIMGMLETRTLDFENLIVLSVNEDLIPSGKSANSFIPFDIRMQYGLPTYKDRNAIFAYHFYRLLQRSKNIHLLYNTEVGDLGGGDKSRFISQLLVELPKYNPEIEIVEKILTGISVKNENEIPIVIPKDELIIEKLLKHAAHGFSPSALNVFRNCSLRFYFQYVAKLREMEDVEETIEAATLGSVVHEVLQRLYTPFIGKNVLAIDVKKMLPQIEILVRKSFRDKYEGGELDYGKNLLVVKVAELFVTNFLQGEMAMLQKDKPELHIISLEEMYLGELEIKLENSDVAYPVKFKGNCDRIDSFGGTTRIIDYKTGNVKISDLTLKEWGMLNEGIKKDKVFQVLFYAYVYSKNQSNHTAPTKAGIVSFRNLSSGFMAVKTPEGEIIDQGVLKDFEIVLSKITKELLESSIPFSQTENPDNCTYCPFVGICNR